MKMIVKLVPTSILKGKNTYFLWFTSKFVGVGFFIKIKNQLIVRRLY